MNLTPAAYSLFATIALITFTVVAFVQDWPIAYLVALPTAICSALITGELMARWSGYNRG